MMTERIPPSVIVQVSAIVVGAAIVWGTNQQAIGAIQSRQDDHEMRIRSIEAFIPRIDEALKPIARMDDRIRVIERAVKQ